MAQPATPLWLTKRRIGDEGLVAQLEDAAGEIPAVDVGQEPPDATAFGKFSSSRKFMRPPGTGAIRDFFPPPPERTSNGSLHQNSALAIRSIISALFAVF